MTGKLSSIRSSENCPRCGSDNNTVSDSRPGRFGRRRRRRCNVCPTAWTTIELSNSLVGRLTKVLLDVAPLLQQTEGQIQVMRAIVQAGVISIETDEGDDDGRVC